MRGYISELEDSNRSTENENQKKAFLNEQNMNELQKQLQATLSVCSWSVCQGREGQNRTLGGVTAENIPSLVKNKFTDARLSNNSKCKKMH